MTEENNLAVTEKVRALAANIDDELYGYDDVPETGGMPSIIKLCQHSTQKKPEGVNNGDFFDSTMGENYGKSISFYVIHVYTPRIKYKQDKTIECRSQDCKTGTAYGSCAACKHSQWDPEEKERCNKQVAAVVMVKGGGLPSLLMFDKARHKIGWELVKKIQNYKNQNLMAPQDQRVPLPFYRFKATSKPTVLNGNQIQTIEIQNDGLLEDQGEAELIMEMKKNVKGFISKVLDTGALETEGKVAAAEKTTEVNNY